MMESLTNEIADKAREIIKEVDAHGGMAKAIETGLPKLKIEAAAAAKQAKIDSGANTIVGINKYKLDNDDELDILDIDNDAVRESQLKRLAELKKNRDNTKAQEALTPAASSSA